MKLAEEMMKVVIAIFFLSITISNSATTSRLVDGNVDWVKFTVDGEEAFDSEERDKHIIRKTTVEGGTTTAKTPTAVNVTPTKNEVNISTCILKFYNYSDLLGCLNGDKPTIRKKLSELKVETEKYDFDLTSPEYIELNTRYLWLLNYYNGLP